MSCRAGFGLFLYLLKGKMLLPMPWVRQWFPPRADTKRTWRSSWEGRTPTTIGNQTHSSVTVRTLVGAPCDGTLRQTVRQDLRLKRRVSARTPAGATWLPIKRLYSAHFGDFLFPGFRPFGRAHRSGRSPSVDFETLRARFRTRACVDFPFIVRTASVSHKITHFLREREADLRSILVVPPLYENVCTATLQQKS